MSAHFPLQYYRQELTEFLRLPSDERAVLVQTFQQLGLVPSVAVLTAEVSKRIGKAPSAVEPIVRWFTAMSMAMQREGMDARSFAAAIVSEARLNERFVGEEERSALASDRECDQLIDQLAAVLNCERSIRATAKALDVSGQSERVVARSRVISDIRPVFGDATDNSPGQPLQAVMLHTLRLECRGEFQHHHFVLSSKDLQQLRDTVERALLKEKVLTNALQEGLRLPVFLDVDE